MGSRQTGGLQKRRKRGQDIALDGMQDRRENVIDRQTSGWTFVESYKKGMVTLHIHGCIRINGTHGVAYQFCATFDRDTSIGATREFKVAESGIGSGEGPGTELSHNGEMHSSMLVDARYLMQTPEWSGPVIPSVIRLYTLDECLRILVNAGDFSVEQASPLLCGHGPSFEYGEFGLPFDVFGDRSSGDGQGEGQMVKPGPHVLNSVSKKEAESVRNWPDGFSKDYILAGLRVVFHGDTTRVTWSPPLDLKQEAIYVFVRPLEFQFETEGRHEV